VLKKKLPAGGAQAEALGKALDGWAARQPGSLPRGALARDL